MSDLLRAEHLAKVYRRGPSAVEVLRDLDLSIRKGERVAIVGASGVGKSTLLNVLGGLDTATSGSVHFEDRCLGDWSDRALAAFRNGSIGFVFQFHYLLPEFTAVENVAMPLWIRGYGRTEACRKSSELLHLVGLSERLDHRPSELSGGEQQRVAIARALIGEPRLILADEPTGNLDIDTARSVSRVLFDIARAGDRSLLIATHNPEIAAMADRVLRMREGKLQPEALG